MRTDNRRIKNTVISIYFLLLCLGLMCTFVFWSIGVSWPIITLFIAVIISVTMIFHYIAAYFEYDSDGAKVSIITRGLILADVFNYRERELEFYKSNLQSFKINNYLIYKSLELRVESTNGKEDQILFNMSLVKPKKIKYIKQSLGRIIKANKRVTI